MFEECSVFIFTLGLTEAWLSKIDGAVFPIAPGTIAPDYDSSNCAFHNFTVTEMEQDLARFIENLRGVNPQVRIILTVSPVPLIATYEPRHVLVSTTYSKAALRVVAHQIARRFDGVDYFPSYEMITGPHTRGAFYADDLREVRPEGVAYVMKYFAKHYLGSDTKSPEMSSLAPMRPTLQDAARAQEQIMKQAEDVICDEEIIEHSLQRDQSAAA